MIQRIKRIQRIQGIQSTDDTEDTGDTDYTGDTDGTEGNGGYYMYEVNVCPFIGYHVQFTNGQFITKPDLRRPVVNTLF